MTVTDHPTTFPPASVLAQLAQRGGRPIVTLHTDPAGERVHLRLPYSRGTNWQTWLEAACGRNADVRREYDAEGRGFWSASAAHQPALSISLREEFQLTCTFPGATTACCSPIRSAR